MTLLEDVSRVVQKINSLHINDPAISKYWDEMASLLTLSEAETLQLLDALDDSDLVDDISSVFEEVSRELQSQKFIECIERLEKKFPELLLVHMISAAKSALIDGRM